MGIPSLFKWLSTKYPKIVSNVIEEQGGEDLSSLPNPNGIEIDNLYLDMNGIIHPCCHPEDKTAPSTEEEMYIEIFKYIDHIFTMIRPRKLLYMAIDGVAPRAKMNQQRSRRFRAAQEEEENRKSTLKTTEKWLAAFPNIDTKEKEHFDSNCITPGTPFMAQLAICLKYYITDRLNNDPGWKNIQVILSDASVPGEGEHKIMDFIRRQKTLNTYDVNTKHVLYGLDADLIMLALATHEPNFWILREDVNVKNKQRACQTCGQSGHDSYSCKGLRKTKVGEFDDQTKYLDLKPFIFVHIAVLREYLDVEMKLTDCNFKWDLERAIDDWVFMCFFVGNDFLPHLPSLEIREGAVELLISIWKTKARDWTGYLTDAGEINLERVQRVLEELGQVEDVTFQERRTEDERRRISRFDRKKRDKDHKNRVMKPKKDKIVFERGPNTQNTLREEAEMMSKLETFPVGNEGELKRKEVMRQERFSHNRLKEDNVSAAKKLKLQLMIKKEIGKPADSLFSMDDFAAKETIAVPVIKEEVFEEEIIEEEIIEEEFIEESEMMTDSIDESKTEPIDSDAEAPQDEIRLWESGWKTRYYENKFQVDVGNEAFRAAVVESYVQGLCWVLKYYYQGVQSWKWFFPYHYSPFASDFKNIKDLKIKFVISKPFKPIEQLLGVFPAASKKHIPKCLHTLMVDDESPIIDFYPLEFPIDLNGKKYLWQGVALLPFIDADRLLKAATPLYKLLTEDEKERNSTGNEFLFCGSGSKAFESACLIYQVGSNKVFIFNKEIELKDGIGGAINKDLGVCFPGSSYKSPLLEFNLEDVENKASISCFYSMPKVKDGYVFKAALLKGGVFPPKVLSDDDVYAVRAGYTQRGRGHGFGRGRGRGMAHRNIQRGLALNRSINNQRLNDRGGFNQRSGGSGYSDRGGYVDRGGYNRGSERGSYNQRGSDRGSNYSRSDSGAYSRFGTTDSPYMGGGGYANRNADGKYRRNEEQRDYQSSYDNYDQYSNKQQYQPTGQYSQSYQSSNQYSRTDQSYGQSSSRQDQYRRQDQPHGQPRSNQYQAQQYQQPQGYNYGNQYSSSQSAQAPSAPSDSAALVAKLLAQLPGNQMKGNGN